MIDRLPPGEGCSRATPAASARGSVIPLAGPGVIRRSPAGSRPARPARDPLGPTCRGRCRGCCALRAPGRQEVERGSAALRALHRDTFENYAPLVRAAGAEDLIRRTGQLHVYSSEEGFRGDAAGWARRRALGVAVEELDRSQIRQIEPALAPIFARAVYLPEHGHTLDPRRLVQRLADRLVRDGGIVLRREVRDLEVGPGRSTRLQHRPGRASRSSTLVIAAGAWSHQLARGAWRPRPPGEPARLPRHRRGSRRRAAHASDVGRAQVRDAPMAGLRFAGTVEFAGLEAPPDYRRARVLLRTVGGVSASEGGARVSEWMGHRPCLPDSCR